MPAANISYPASAAAVVFGVYHSARAAFRLGRKSPAIRPCLAPARLHRVYSTPPNNNNIVQHTFLSGIIRTKGGITFIQRRDAIAREQG
jgi:hypothetical protein